MSALRHTWDLLVLQASLSGDPVASGVGCHWEWVELAAQCDPTGSSQNSPVVKLTDTRLSWAGSDAKPGHACTKWSPVFLFQ